MGVARSLAHHVCFGLMSVLPGPAILAKTAWRGAATALGRTSAHFLRLAAHKYEHVFPTALRISLCHPVARTEAEILGSEGNWPSEALVLPKHDPRTAAQACCCSLGVWDIEISPKLESPRWRTKIATRTLLIYPLPQLQSVLMLLLRALLLLLGVLGSSPICKPC